MPSQICSLLAESPTAALLRCHRYFAHSWLRAPPPQLARFGARMLRAHGAQVAMEADPHPNLNPNLNPKDRDRQIIDITKHHVTPRRLSHTHSHTSAHKHKRHYRPARVLPNSYTVMAVHLHTRRPLSNTPTVGIKHHSCCARTCHPPPPKVLRSAALARDPHGLLCSPCSGALPLLLRRRLPLRVLLVRAIHGPWELAMGRPHVSFAWHSLRLDGELNGDVWWLESRFRSWRSRVRVQWQTMRTWDCGPTTESG